MKSDVVEKARPREGARKLPIGLIEGSPADGWRCAGVLFLGLQVSAGKGERKVSKLIAYDELIDLHSGLLLSLEVVVAKWLSVVLQRKRSTYQNFLSVFIELSILLSLVSGSG
ncbi:hypothetical protein WAI453_007794 [Rhynchosporium graminicola]